MTDNTHKNPTEGSSGIPAQGSDGVAGSFHAVPVKDAMADGAVADCRENIRKLYDEKKDMIPRRVGQDASASVSRAASNCRLHNSEPNAETGDKAPRIVERATGLRGRSICSGRITKSTYRKRTDRDLKFPDAEVPYVKTERAIRALVCSLMERQDRMTETFFLKSNDLEYRVDDLELCKKSRAIKQSDIEKEAGN